MIFPPGAVLGKAQEETRQTSRTYRLDLVNGRIVGMTDGAEAVKQFIFKALSTERFAHFIYSRNTGHEIRVGGNGGAFEIERWITEALIIDDRITGIENFQSVVSGDELAVSFTVVSIFGRFEERRTFANV